MWSNRGNLRTNVKKFKTNIIKKSKSQFISFTILTVLTNNKQLVTKNQAHDPGNDPTQSQQQEPRNRFKARLAHNGCHNHTLAELALHGSVVPCAKVPTIYFI